MKQHYKTGIYIFFFTLLSIAYVLEMRELSSQKSNQDKLTPLKSKPKQQPATVPDSTINSIQQALAKREYNISFDTEKNTLQSPNRKQGLRAYYKPGELTVKNRVDSAGIRVFCGKIDESLNVYSNPA